jgi:hypothetical protein
MEIGLWPLRCLSRMSIAIAMEPGTPTRMIYKIAYAALLLGLVVWGYAEVAASYFLADDFNVLNIISQAETFRDGTAVDTGWEYFRPLTALSFWLNYLWFGAETATSFHIFALLVHWCNAMLVARLAWRFCPHAFAAGFAGAAFAVLPVHPECITWIAARADVLCATGTLLLITGWLDYLRNQRGAAALVEVLIGLVFALLTKDSAMIMPVILIALAIIYRGPGTKRLGWVFAGIGLVFAVYMVSRIAALGGFVGSQSTDDAHHLTINVVNAIDFTADAMRAMVMPGPWLVQKLLCLILIVYIVLRHQTVSKILQGIWPLLLVFLLQLAPVANAVTLDLRAGTNTRFLYIPSIYFCVGLGVLLHATLRVIASSAAAQGRTLVMRLAAGMLVLVYATTIRNVNQSWAEAGVISRDIVTQLQGFAQDKAYRWVFIHDLPDTHEGAYVFRNGIDTAIKLFVSKDMVFPPHGNITLKDWQERSAQRRADPTAYPEILLLKWDRIAGHLIEP